MHIIKQTLKNHNLKENDLILDIETSGVHRELSNILVVGLMFPSCRDDNFIQLIGEKGEEKLLLGKLYSLIKDRNIITYNGKHFDLPFINSRYLHHGLEAPVWEAEFDIFRFLISNRPITDISMFSLQEIEKYLSIERFENFEIEEDEALYLSIDDCKLKKIALHNRYDVINTEKVLSLVKKIEDEKRLSLDLNGEIVDLKIESFDMDKDILEISLSSNSNKFSSFLTSQTWLDWKMYNLRIRLKLNRGFISKDNIAHVFIQEKGPYIKDSSTYKLRENILLIMADGRYNLTNIKNLIGSVIRGFMA